MAQNDRWRNDQERYGYRDDDRDRWRNEDYRRGGRGGEYRGGRGTERMGDLYGSDYRSRDMTGSRGGRDYGGGYGVEGYGSSYQDYGRGSSERGYGGNDRNRGFYGADQEWGGHERRPHQDTWGYRGERSGWDRATDEMASWFGNDDAARRREQDARQGDQGAQHHRGRGPKGYTRSDERIREDVSDRLTDDPYVDASEIEVSVSNCEVTLSGTVDSREAKRRAEDCAERVSGVTHVQNNLRVQQQSTSQGTAAGTAGSIGIGSTTGAAGTGLSGAQGDSTEAGISGTSGSKGRRKAGANT
ncbi:BON domain-containing protein [Microvirga makkahensis]|uniref:BON domain-containing protein n=1 Tax=Microvirga makkahensis TaxID=1128670 RepID=A0A7X3MX27_9HYPH|nr:BON domain-containing protein [Microvirga makkahensis]MXQ14784.1 BON domain-containing protein [Microvirga makkahensis]